MGPPLLQKLHRGSEDRILIVATSQTMLGETLIPTGVWQVPNSLCSHSWPTGVVRQVSRDSQQDLFRLEKRDNTGGRATEKIN